MNNYCVQNQEEIDSLIAQRLELFDEEVDSILKAKPEDLKNKSITRSQFEDYINASGQKVLDLAANVKVPTLSTYDHYMGKVAGIQVAHKLISLMVGKKIPNLLAFDDIESENVPIVDYSCSVCGHDEIFHDHRYCPYCGVELFVEEDK